MNKAFWLRTLLLVTGWVALIGGYPDSALVLFTGNIVIWALEDE